LLPAFTNANVTCPAGNDTVPPTHACTRFSVPNIANDIFWQNRAFHITAGGGTTGTVVQLLPALTQATTGACPTANYWDIGAYNDTAPNNHGSGVTLHPTYSILDDPGDYAGANNVAGSSSTITTQYCNGSRVPPEIATLLCSGTNGHANAPGCIQPGTVGVGTTVPGGVPDSLGPPLPAFTLTPAATVDEGSNWINMFYGPLSLSNPVSYTTSGTVLPPLGNFAPPTGSPAVGAVPALIAHPALDFFGNARPDGGTPCFDIGAVEIPGGADSCGGGGGAPLAFAPTTRAFGNATRGNAALGAPTQIFTLRNAGSVPLTGISQATLGGANPTEFSIVRALSTCGPAGGGQLAGQTTLASGAACIVTVQFRPLTTPAPGPTGAQAATVSVTDLAGTQTATLTGTAN
jgi:hypothetical protein